MSSTRVTTDNGSYTITTEGFLETVDHDKNMQVYKGQNIQISDENKGTVYKARIYDNDSEVTIFAKPIEDKKLLEDLRIIAKYLFKAEIKLLSSNNQ